MTFPGVLLALKLGKVGKSQEKSGNVGKIGKSRVDPDSPQFFSTFPDLPQKKFYSRWPILTHPECRSELGSAILSYLECRDGSESAISTRSRPVPTQFLSGFYLPRDTSPMVDIHLADKIYNLV